MPDQQDSDKYRFRFLGGPSYTIAERPPVWPEGKAVHRSGRSRPCAEDLPLADFTEIEDFEVVLEELVGSGMGYHLYFYSQSRGFLASFPWLDHAEIALATPNFPIAIGTSSNPFEDCEQGWELLIFQHLEYIYILQGIFEEGSGFNVWFKVLESTYIREWQKAIDVCKTTF